MENKKERKAVNMRGIREETQVEPRTLKRETSTQKFKKGGSPKLRPAQRLIARRRPEGAELW